ncbi:hypothetical protein Krac_5924 [Ktedonobacter racemifer DSM 44963]|uniref:Uncharacterized protein n=1 Tax=Ktedonobacter racemifer DSM 44963 TaxID=485913 RepID=D6TX83_KTERA|nr:hypothetical protein Krac_5924 [Ktedonobacter racemifer DSM 44963]
MHIRVCLTNLDIYLPGASEDLRECMRSCGIEVDKGETHIEEVKCLGHCYPCNLGLFVEVDGRPVQLAAKNSHSRKQG